MMFSGLYKLFVYMFPNTYMQLLYILTFSAIFTWLFLQKKLNPYIGAALAILGCAFEIFVSFFFIPIGWTGNKIDTHISRPIRNVTKRIHIPILIKATIYAVLGIAIFYLDHKYSKSIFESDELFVMYPMEINGVKFWVSQSALWIGGFFIGLSILYTLTVIFRWLNRLLDRPIQISFMLYR